MYGVGSSLLDYQPTFTNPSGGSNAAIIGPLLSTGTLGAAATFNAFLVQPDDASGFASSGTINGIKVNMTPVSSAGGTIYAGIFIGGNVGVGTTTPSTQFAVNGNSTFTGSITITGTVRAGNFTVSGLPTATTSNGYAGSPGATAFVTDATTSLSSATVGTAPAGGGSNGVPVFSDGTAWLMH